MNPIRRGAEPSHLDRLNVALLGLWIPRRDDQGASLVEYSLLVAFLALACLGALEFFGGATGASLDDSGQSIIAAY